MCEIISAQGVVHIQIYMEIKSFKILCKTNLNLGLYNMVEGQTWLWKKRTEENRINQMFR